MYVINQLPLVCFDMYTRSGSEPIQTYDQPCN